jgi:hypothetical protein
MTEQSKEQLQRDNEFMLALLVDIERAIDHGDRQQIAVAIKRLRDLLGTKKLLDGALKPGLERS